MTQEEVIGLQDLDDAFVLAQAQKNAQDDSLEQPRFLLNLVQKLDLTFDLLTFELFES